MLQQPLRGRSARLFGAGEGLLEAGSSCRPLPRWTDRSLYERTVSATRSQLGDAAFEEAQAEGRAMTFEQAEAYALEDHDATPNQAAGGQTAQGPIEEGRDSESHRRCRHADLRLITYGLWLRSTYLHYILSGVKSLLNDELRASLIPSIRLR